jgi:ABC-type bacteriocin/lantibiotic exporter with double-glycine peptidase domain
MKTLFKTIKLLTVYERRHGLSVLILASGMALFETAGVASIMPFLAVLGSPDMVRTNSILKASFEWSKFLGVKTQADFIIFLGFGAFLIIIVSAIYRTITQYSMNRFIEMLRHSISARLLEAYLHQPYEFFLDRHSGEMSKAILSEVDQLIHNVVRPGYIMLAFSIVLIAITTLLVLINPLLAISTLAIFGGLYALFYLIMRFTLRQHGLVLKTSNHERFIAANEAFGGIKQIKLFGCEQVYLNHFKLPSIRYASTLASNQTLNQVPYYLIEAIAFGGIIFISTFMLINGENLGKALPILGLYAFSAYRIKPTIQNIFHGFAGLRFGQSIIDNLYTDIYLNKTTDEISLLKLNALKVRKRIDIERISYTYPNSAKAALQNLNISIPIGKIIGIVGSSGSGKTTLVDLILGLLTPSEGKIFVDGQPINTENLRAWQQNIGYVPQNIFLADTSIAENIAFGITKDKINFDQLLHCAKLSEISELISELPNGFETVIGEGGIRLSGGQRQRIGIARALYHNPEILIFDEATNALDRLTEKTVMNSIEALANQKTIILIAHRLSLLRNCNQIFFLKKGQIKAKGTFEELIEKNTEFKAMAQE